MTTDSFVVKPLRFPGGSIGELAVNGTVNDLAVAGARPLALTHRDDPRGGPATRTSCAPRSRRSRAPRARRASRSSPATRRSSSAATPTRCTSRTTGVGAPDPRARAGAAGPAARRQGPAVRLDRRARHGDHARPRRVRARGRGRVRHPQPVAGRRRAAGGRRRGPALHARRHPRRRRLGAQRARPRVRRRDGRARGGRARQPGRGRGGGDPGDRPHVRGQRGQARRLRRAGAARRRPWPRCAPSTGCERAAEIGEVRTEPPGMVLVETSFGGRRVMDQLVGDPLPRIC